MKAIIASLCEDFEGFVPEPEIVSKKPVFLIFFIRIKGIIIDKQTEFEITERMECRH